MINVSLRFTIVSIIAVVTLACLILSYQAMFATICGDLINAARQMFWGLFCAVSALLLIKYRDDLIDA
jgi:tellurite resistance protein TehA-like permease